VDLAIRQQVERDEAEEVKHRRWRITFYGNQSKELRAQLGKTNEKMDRCLCVFVFVCVCVFIGVCINPYACMYVCMYAYMYVCMYVCMHICVYVFNPSLCIYASMHL
jgi:hypothetical protein